MGKPKDTPLPIDPEHQPARRLFWVDVARGIGILLVVYGHALRAQAPIDPRAMEGLAMIGSVIFFMSFWQGDLVKGFAGETIVDLLQDVVGVATVVAASMPIYVMHALFSASLGSLLIAVGVQAPTLSLIACTAIGLIVPLAFWAIAKQFGWLTWLGLGSDDSREKAVRA